MLLPVPSDTLSQCHPQAQYLLYCDGVVGGGRVSPGGGGVGARVLLGALVIDVVLDGMSHLGFLQHGFVKSVTSVQYSGRSTYRSQLMSE